MRHGFLVFLKSLLGLAGLALTGGLAVPIAAYVVGKSVIGPYEGKLGLSDYLSSVYAAAGRGEVLAWGLMLAPALVVLAWYVVIRLGRASATDGN